MIAGEHRQPVVHLFGTGSISPMFEHGCGITQRESLAGRMDFQSETDRARAHELDGSSDQA